MRKATLLASVMFAALAFGLVLGFTPAGATEAPVTTVGPTTIPQSTPAAPPASSGAQSGTTAPQGPTGTVAPSTNGNQDHANAPSAGSDIPHGVVTTIPHGPGEEPRAASESRVSNDSVAPGFVRGGVNPADTRQTDTGHGPGFWYTIASIIAILVTTVLYKLSRPKTSSASS